MWALRFSLLCYYAMLTVAATKTKPIGNCDNCRFTIILNSISMAAPIGLPPKMAEFCHTSNRSLLATLRLLEGINGLYVFSLFCVITLCYQRRLQKQNQLVMMTIADLQLLSTAPQRQRQSVCHRRWPSFATLPTDHYWGINTAMPYCGCILIPLLPVGGRSEIKAAGL